MSEKEKGLYKKYEITKLSNPTKKVDAIVLEFDDPIARKVIMYWAIEMIDEGYEKCGKETLDKLKLYKQL